MNLRKAAEMALEIIEGEWPADDEIASPVMYALREALAKPERAPITEGWQLVPKEPTKEMSDTFWSAYIPAPDGIAQSCSFEDFHDFRYMYKAMLDAAPKQEISLHAY